MWKSSKLSFVLGLLLLLVITPSPADDAVDWVDSTRDLYIDGQLDRNAQLFRTRDSEQAAIVSAALPNVVVFDRESLGLGILDKEELVPSSDRTKASSPRLSSLDAEGEVLRVDERSFILRFSGHTVLVAPHQGHAGEIALDELWRTVPVWKARAASYEPSPEVVAALHDVGHDVELTVVFGTWCGDSKRYVPELLKTVDLAANNRVGIRLVSIRRGFKEPLDFVRDQKIINVPTVIITRNNEEIGRIVETPALETIEADLAAILAGRPPTHEGRWKREHRLARGTYEYLSDGIRKGTEEWEIFAAPDDTTLVHSRLQLGERTTETWHRRDAGGVTNFVEVTRRGGRELSRSRFWIEEGRLQSITRGNTTGIVEQTAELPDGWTVLLPSAVDAVGSVQGGVSSSPAFRLHGAGAPTSGRLYLHDLERGDREQVSTPAGRFDARRMTRRVDGVESVWWLHPELGLPVEGRREDGVRVILVEIERFAEDG
jgi:thiol-disulfide isomerase/thioredoxin